MFKLSRYIQCLVFFVMIQAEEVWKPTAWEHCRTNSDCSDLQKICCSITPSLGKRDGMHFPEYVHYCLPYKTESFSWCELKRQYNASTPNYYGLCPCGPGLKCTPTTELDPKNYPRDKFGKCKKVAE